MTIFHTLLFGIGMMIAGALITSRIEFKLAYNLWDWLHDKWDAFRGRLVYDAHITVKLMANEAHLVEGLLGGAGKGLSWIIRRR